VLSLLPAIAGATISFAPGDIVLSTSRFSTVFGNETSIIVYDANGAVKSRTTVQNPVTDLTVHNQRQRICRQPRQAI